MKDLQNTIDLNNNAITAMSESLLNQHLPKAVDLVVKRDPIVVGLYEPEPTTRQKKRRNRNAFQRFMYYWINVIGVDPGEPS